MSDTSDGYNDGAEDNGGDAPFLLWNADDADALQAIPIEAEQECVIRGLLDGRFDFRVVGPRVAIGWIVGALKAEGDEEPEQPS